MFKCDLCKHQVESGISCSIQPKSIRLKTYIFDRYRTYGWEIEKEVKLCPTCSKDYQAPIPKKDSEEIQKDNRLNYKKLFSTRRKKSRTLHMTQVKKVAPSKKSRKNQKRGKVDEWKNYKYRGNR